MRDGRTSREERSGDTRKGSSGYLLNQTLHRRHLQLIKQRSSRRPLFHRWQRHACAVRRRSSMSLAYMVFTCVRLRHGVRGVSLKKRLASQCPRHAPYLSPLPVLLHADAPAAEKFSRRAYALQPRLPLPRQEGPQALLLSLPRIVRRRRVLSANGCYRSRDLKLTRISSARFGSGRSFISNPFRQSAGDGA